MNQRTRIELSDNIATAVQKMCEGNLGALRVLLDLASKAPKIDPQSAMGPYTALLDLDSLGVYGSRIWMFYKDVCGEDYVNVLGVLRAWQLGFLGEGELLSAIDGRKELDVFALLSKVREELPAFQKAEAPSVS